MRRVTLLLLWLLVGPGLVWAANETAGDPVALLRRRLGTIMPGSYIVAGCLPAVPVASTTLAAFACEGVVYTAGASVPVTQEAVTVALTGGNGTYWLALHPDATTVVGGWNRRTGTHYLWVKADTQPALSVGAVLAKVTIAGAVITVVEDFRVPASFVRNGTYEVTDPLYGGVADDSTDIGPALRLAIAAVIAQQGGVVRIPQGLYALASGVVIPAGVEIRGDGWSPSQNATNAAAVQLPRRGTWLHISTTGFSPFTITGGNGIIIGDLAFDYDQPAPAVGWAPTIYPYAIAIQTPVAWMNGDIHLENLFFFKASHGINQESLSGQSGGRLRLRGIYGQVFQVGIRLEFVADVSRMSDVHLWPYWSVDQAVMDYQNTNMIGLALLRTDALLLHNIFVLGANVGIHFFDNAFGPSSGLQATNVSLDVVRTGIYANQTGTSGQFANLRTFGSWNGVTVAPNFENATGILVDKGFNVLDVSNFEAGSLGGSCARVTFGASVLMLSNVRCNNFNLGGGGLPALQATAGALLVSGTQYITTPHGAPSYGGAFLSNTFPNGAILNQDGTFFLNIIGGNPVLSFGPNDLLQWLPSTNQFQLSTDAGTYNTGGVKKYLCILDGVLTVGTTCP